MPEIFPSIDSTSIDITTNGDLEISQQDCRGNYNPIISIPAPLVPFFMKKLKEIVREGGKK